MSFSPLPESFLHDLQRCRAPGRRILDLGCGDGVFLAGLDTGDGLRVDLDRIGPCAGTCANVVGDALTPPLTDGTCDLVVAANLFRHIVSHDAEAGFLDRWWRLLGPGGALYLFEDEPLDQPVGARNYRDLQKFLRRLMPDRRGELVPRRSFEDIARAADPGAVWRIGRARNQTVLDPEAVGSLLRGDGHPTGEAARLLHTIEAEGLNCGEYWWACRRKESEPEQTP